MSKYSFHIINRRDFIRYSGAAAMGAAAFAGAAEGKKKKGKEKPKWTGPQRKLKPEEKLNIAFVGLGGKGHGTLNTIIDLDENVVALCDTNQEKLNAAARQAAEKGHHPKLYRDYRELLDKEKSVQAVVISTPDHWHAPIALRAIKMGKHVYCEKPLTHSIYEARQLKEAAAEARIVAQMGNQGSGTDGLRRAVEVIQAGVIGKVREAHVWSNRPIWPQGIPRPEGEDPVPPTLNWDAWLGPAPLRPYKEGVYHPFKWRGWHDFGTGALGDMACHTLNMPYRALKLGYACEVECEFASDTMPETYPKQSTIRFVFPEREGLPPMTLWWHDGGRKPKDDIIADVLKTFGEAPKSGCLLVGDKGTLFSGDDYGSRNYIRLKGDEKLLGLDNHEAAKPVPQTIPRIKSHYMEWTDACKTGGKPYSSFDTAAFLTEIILVGCVALRAGVKLEWDGPAMRAKNTSKTERFVKPPQRTQWL